MKVNLNGIKMNVVHTDTVGVVGQETIFEFTQSSDVITAHYKGGDIVVGHLVGVLTGESLTFKFVQMESGNILSAGESNCDIESLPDGRLRLIEHFVFEELPE
jgi:hypothetical protein